jgi:tetratricopeptide (TPR) repeat protein
MDALLEGWDTALWEAPGPLPGHLPGRLRAADKIDHALSRALRAAKPEVVKELERWWLAVDHYSPLTAQEFGACGGELQALLAEPSRRDQERRVLKEPAFQSWGLAVRLLAESKARRFEDPHGATDLAQVAMRVAQVIDPHRYEPRWVADLEARCWAHVGNGLRILGEMRGAADAFGTANRLLAAGTGRGLPRARVSSLAASLLTETRNTDKAEELLRGVVRFYEQAELAHEEGRARLKLSKIVCERGDAAAALEILRAGVQKIDASREPQLSFVAQEGLAVNLLELGRADEADAVMSNLPAPTSVVLLLRGVWLRAQIHEAQGRFAEAETALIQVRQVYLKRELGYDAALVSLDLAAVYLQQGEPAKVKALAQEIYPLFMAQGVEREALAALLVFRRAAEEEALTVEFVKSLSKVLKRIRQ